MMYRVEVKGDNGGWVRITAHGLSLDEAGRVADEAAARGQRVRIVPCELRD